MAVIASCRLSVFTRFLRGNRVLQQRRYKNKSVEGAKYTKVARDHEYKTVYPWKRREELAKYLYESITYNHNGLVAVNKPYGIAVHQQAHDQMKRKPIVKTLSSSDLYECDITIDDTLPFLADKLRLQQLRIVKAPERYTSGITLLASTKNAEDEVSMAIRRARAATVPFYAYWAVTSVIPVNLQEKKQRVGIKLVDVAEHDEKAAVIDTRPSKNSVKNQTLKSTFVEYEVAKLSREFNCALVEISTTTIKWHFLRVYLAHKLAPVLGDALYSTRVKTVLGKPIAVSPFNKACYNPPTLSVDLCNRLQLAPSFVPSIPTHLHLHRMTLVGRSRDRDIVINTLPSRYFLWTCKELGLSPDPAETMERLVS